MMKALLDWLDARTGLRTATADCLHRPVAGGPSWQNVWPSTLAFLFVVQAITGLVLWMYYSPSSQTAWESVYYVQHHVLLGWLLRAIHYYAAQSTLVLVGIYLLQMIVRGTYRAPRELLFWTVLGIGLITLGLNLTGDLLAWDQNSYWATHVRTGFLFLLPGVGDWLYKLAVGGAEFGHLTLTRFLALHIGVLTAALAGLLGLHAWLSRRSAQGGLSQFSFNENGTVPLQSPPAGSAAYWPGQALRDVAACLVVMAAVLALSARHGVSGPEAGVELGAPADPSEDPGTARPEWSFRGLFQFRELFPAKLEILPIFVLSGLTVAVFFAMPLVGKSGAGHAFNLAFTALVLVGLAVLSWQSYSADAKSEKFIAASAAGRRQAERAKQLASAGIPAGGALALLRDDPKTQGPRLFLQYCASCHEHPEAVGDSPRKDPPSAPNLGGFATRDWLCGFFDAKEIRTPKYFGNTKFKKGQMVGYVCDNVADKDKSEVEEIIAALLAEAKPKSPDAADHEKQDAEDLAKRMEILRECTGCHTLHGKGTAKGPDLTGYGSRAWLAAIIGNPADERFYRKQNDRMPAYADPAVDPANHTLSVRELGLLVDWLRGE
jgi:ubiquinol-cytochrome c reductase cytochrome b subunit